MAVRETLEQQVIKTIVDYEMVRPGDRLLVALSGGKDSLSLTATLGALKAAGRLDVDLAAVWVETDAGCGSGILNGPAGEICRRYRIELKHLYFPILADAGEKLSCFYCAMRRRSAMFKLATRQGYDSLVFGHHRDDIAETLLMNMLFHGNVSTMSPVVQFFGGKLTVIRPLARTSEASTAAWIEEAGLTAVVCTCPRSGDNFRATAKSFLKEVSSEHPEVTERLFEAMRKAGTS